MIRAQCRQHRLSGGDRNQQAIVYAAPSQFVGAICIGCLLLGPGTLHAQQVPISDESATSDRKEQDNGEDFTRPLTRLDIRYQFENVEKPHHGSQTFTLRADRPVPLDGSWKLAFRLDLPLRYTDVIDKTDNPLGQYRFGMGDLLTQVGIIKTLDSRWAVGAGSQLIFPTASEAEMGGGKYQAVPIMGARYMVPEISAGSFAEGLIRYDFDYAGDSHRKQISNLQFQPQLNINLPDSWFVELYPNADIRVNLAHRATGDTGNLFLPFDALVGKMFGKTLITTVEIGFPIVNDYKVYNFKTEARMGFFF